jgi:hypothetical protein
MSHVDELVQSGLLTPRTTISFFGDSITWMGGYLGLLKRALRHAGAANVTLHNRGFNGACIKDLVVGGNLEGISIVPYDQALAADTPDVVVIFVGINDAFQPPARHSSPEEFEVRVFAHLCALFPAASHAGGMWRRRLSWPPWLSEHSARARASCCPHWRTWWRLRSHVARNQTEGCWCASAATCAQCIF